MSERQLRVLQILLSPRIGGAESLAESLKGQWSEKEVLSKTYFLDSDERLRPSRWSRWSGLWKEVHTWKPDVVVAHSALPNLYARISTPSGTPVVVVMHSAVDDFESPKLRWAERIIRFRTAAIVAVSESQAAQYAARFGRGIPLAVIPNGIRSDASPKDSLAEAPRTAVTVSRIAMQKNPQLWLSTAAHMRSNHPDLRLAWWGPPALEPQLRHVFSSAALQQSGGLYHGATTNPVSVLQSGDIFFHPADREAHSIGILEAAAIGLPIVCSATVATTLPPSMSPICFIDGDPASASAALSTVVDSWPLHAQRALAASAEIRHEYSIAKCSEKYLALFAQILGPTKTISTSFGRQEGTDASS